MDNNQFTNPETRARYQAKEGFDWNRKILLVGKYFGPIKDITPEVAERLAGGSRNELLRIEPNEQTTD